MHKLYKAKISQCLNVILLTRFSPGVIIGNVVQKDKIDGKVKYTILHSKLLLILTYAREDPEWGTEGPDPLPPFWVSPCYGKYDQ